MSAGSATVPPSPVVSLASMGGAGLRPPGSTSQGGKCCETGRPVSTDPLTGQTICSCQYNPGALLMAAASYPRGVGVGVGVPGLTEAAGMYSNPYATAAMQAMIPTAAPGSEHAAFYSTMGALQGTAGYYAFDPYGAYSYGNGFSMDPNARRKNATRESTQTLKAWLSEHRKNPYPTKGEKIMLAIITKMTLTQVSTWFANARRRLKKENKMTWSPRNRCGDEDDLDNDDLDDDDDKMNGDDNRENDTNNNRDFSDDHSDNDVDILNCGPERDSVGFNKSTHSLLSNSLRSDDINILEDEDSDSSAISGRDDKHKINGSSLGSAFTLVSPSRLSGIHSHIQSNSLSPNGRCSPHSVDNHKTDSLLDRMRSIQETNPKLTSPTTSSVTSQKPKIWSVADVVSKSSSSESEDRHSERSHSPSRSPHHLNGQHVPHPAFPNHAGHPSASPHSLGMARGIGLWNPTVVTSLANMAAAGRYHPYSQGLLTSPHHTGITTGALPNSRHPFPGPGIPSSMVPGLLGGPHSASGHPGLNLPHSVLAGSTEPTDLRKTAQTGSHNNTGRLTESPESKSMGTSSSHMRSSPKESHTSHNSPTAFKPVPRR